MKKRKILNFVIFLSTITFAVGHNDPTELQKVNAPSVGVKVKEKELAIRNEEKVSVLDRQNVIEESRSSILTRPLLWTAFESRLEIFENNDYGTLLYSYRALEVDGPILYSLLNVPMTSHSEPYVVIEPNFGHLRTNVMFDAETYPGSFEFEVVATKISDPNESISETVTVFVNDLNDNYPAFPDGSTQRYFDVTINENHVGPLPGLEELIIIDADRQLENTHVVAWLTTHDPITQDLINDVFKLTPTNGYGGGNFAIWVNPAAVVDYENSIWQQVVEFNVHVEGVAPPWHFAVGSIRLTVQDVNDNAPEFYNIGPDNTYEYSVVESVGAGSYVGSIVAHDSDLTLSFGPSSIRYSWSGFSPSDLELDELTGEIRTRVDNAFDRETQPVETYIVEATDSQGGQGARSTIAVLRFIVLDVNDEPPVITSATRQVRIAEGVQPNGIIFENIQIHDPDESTHLSVQCYTQPIVASSWFNCIPVEHQSGNVEVTIVLGSDLPDYEQAKWVEITLVANDFDDSGAPLHTTSEIFNIIIDNINDEPPVFEPFPPHISVWETPQCPTGEECLSETQREIYHFRVTDADSNPDEIWFRLEPGLETDFVEIDEKYGILRRRYGVKIDREQYANLYVSVTALDCGRNGYYCAEQFAVTTMIEIIVQDINDEVPVFHTVDTEFFVSEFGDSTIYQFFATDADEGEFGTVHYLVDETYMDGDKFTINYYNGILFALTTFDRETVDRYEVRVIARDNAGGRIYNEAEQIITIIITDENDNAPQFLNPIFQSLEEDRVQEGTELGRVTVFDADEKWNDNSIVDVQLLNVFWDCHRCAEGLHWHDYFGSTFDWNTNEFMIYAKVDFHRTIFYGTYHFEIIARDRGAMPLENFALYTFSILDVNDNAPVFIYPAANTQVYIRDDLEVGIVLTEFTTGKFMPELQASDDDDPTTGNGQVSYSINPDQEEANRYFYIEQHFGKFYLVVKTSLVFTNEPILVEIIATDGGIPPLETRQLTHITVVPTQNAEPIFNNGSAVVKFAENDSNSVADLPLAVDPDTIPGLGNAFGEVICYFIIDGDVTNSFHLNQKTNRLSLRRLLNYDEVSSYNLVILAKNGEEDDCRYSIPGPNPDDNSSSFLRVTVEVTDVNEGSIVGHGDHRAHTSFSKVRFDKFERFRKGF